LPNWEGFIGGYWMHGPMAQQVVVCDMGGRCWKEYLFQHRVFLKKNICRLDMQPGRCGGETDCPTMLVVRVGAIKEHGWLRNRCNTMGIAPGRWILHILHTLEVGFPMMRTMLSVQSAWIQTNMKSPRLISHNPSRATQPHGSPSNTMLM